MKSLVVIGVLLVVLGLLVFVMPIPHHKNHGIKIGAANISVQTETDQKLPPSAGVVLIAGGVIALVVGVRKK